MGSETRRRAMALLMVVMVLAILVVIGTPFAVSMLLQEKSGHSFLEDAKARFAAEGARNHAVAQLSRGHDFLERSRKAQAPWNDPYGDGVAEAAAELADLSAMGVTAADPKGAIWGVDVEDEQGKLNVRTVPARVVQVLDGLIRRGAVPRWHYVTEHSQRPACWVLPQAVRTLALDQNGLSLTVDNAFALGNASRIRLTKGREQVVGTYAEIAELLNGQARAFEPPGSMIELEAIHPVNPNVAPREVLAAVFTGLAVQMLTQQQIQQMLANGQDVPPQDQVTPQEAMALATRIVQNDQTFSTPRDFFDFLVSAAQAGAIDEGDAGAIFLNSMNPFDARLVDQTSGAWLGTVPFCYESQNVWLVEATGVANNPAGNESGKRVVRDVVEVAPSEKLTWSIESQYDFDREMWRGQGARVVTWPERSFMGGDPKALWLGQDQRIPVAQIGFKPSLDRDQDAGYLTLRAPQDRRDPGNIRWRNSWDDRHEGIEVKGAPMAFQPQQVGLEIPQNQIDNDAGGVEFWVKFDGRPNDTFFLDLAQKEWENRLSFKYDGGRGELVLSACDACADKVASQVRYPITFDRETWYHLAAVWKSTKYAQLGLMVDGFPKGTFQIVDDRNVNSVTQLTSALTESDATVSVKSTNGYPDSGAIEVGDEAIEYTGRTATSFTGCVRGARGTATTGQGGLSPGRADQHPHVHEHPAGAGVTPYGYANYLRGINTTLGPISINFSGIPLVSGLVRQDFGADPQAIVNRPPRGVRSSDMAINVGVNPNQNPAPASATDGFPTTGYIQLGTEIVYYTGVLPDQFTGCQRGQFGTSAADWPVGTPVMLWGIPVTDVAGYPDPSIIQIGDEWIIGRPDPSGPDGPCFIGFQIGNVPIPPIRGRPVGPPAAHVADDPVIPVFGTRDPFCGANGSSGDVVTIVEANQAGAKEQIRVRHAVYLAGLDISLAAFDAFQSKAYAADGVTRLMKFPSGELLSVSNGPVTFGSEAAGVAKGNGARLVGTVDDLRFFASNKGAFWTDQQVLPRDTTVVVSQAGSNAEGVIKLGDELVGYVGSSGNQPMTLANAKRGYLKSPIQAHGTGERFINMQFFPIAATTAEVADKAAAIPVSTVNGFAPTGLVLIDDEVIGYTDTSSGLAGPMDKNGDAVFRGRFGTVPSSHDAASLVYAIPFRYFDFSRTEAFDNQMAYWQGALRATGAKFLRLRWEEERRRQKAIVRVLARVDGRPSWDEVGSSGRGGLFEFLTADARNALDVPGNELQVQVRFEYQRGAFDDDTWKYSPMVKGIWVEYEQPEIVRSHEEE